MAERIYFKNLNYGYLSPVILCFLCAYKQRIPTLNNSIQNAF